MDTPPVSRDWNRELEFSDEELVDMQAELRKNGDGGAASDAAKRKRKGTLRVPVDVVPRRETRGASVQIAVTPSDLAVEQAFTSAPVPMWGPERSGPNPDTAGVGQALDEPELTIDATAQEELVEVTYGLPVSSSPLGASLGASLDETVQRILVGGPPPAPWPVPPPAEPIPPTLPPASAEMVTAGLSTVPVSSQSVIVSSLSDLPATAPLPIDLPPRAKPQDSDGAAAERDVTPIPGAPVQMLEEELTSEEIEVVSEASVPRPASEETLGAQEAPAAERAAPPPLQPPTPPPSAMPGDSAPAATAKPRSGPRPRRRQRTRAWFEEIFDEDYLRTLPFMTPRQTKREADFIEASLGVAKNSHLLDIGSGYGRHALELAARGYQVVGVDLSLPLLIRAADEAQRRGLEVSFVHGDMRELSFDDQFEGAYCMFTTFGYFDDETNRKVAQGIARALKPKGRLLIELVNRDYIVAGLPTRVWWEGDGCVVLEEVDFNYYNSRIASRRSVVFEDGRQLEQEISVRAYSLHELGKLLHQAGFRVIEVSGSLATRGQFFGPDSKTIYVTAEKRTG